MFGLGRHTLLLVQRDGLARADFHGRGAPQRLGLQRRARPAGDSLVELIEVAAGAEPLPSRVWILTDEIVAQTIELDARSVRGLDDEELQQALAYEASELTGIASSESATAWRGSPGGRSFLVAQMARAELEQVDDIVRGLGGRLAGLCHPAGLPRRFGLDGLGDSEHAPYRRSESWSEVHAEVVTRDGEGLDVRILRSAEWRGQREEASLVPPTDWLVATTASGPPPAGGARLLRLDDDAVLEMWLDGWMRELASRSTAVPVLVPQRPPLSVRSRVAWGLAAAGAVAGLAALDHGALTTQRDELVARLVSLNAPIERLARERNELATLRKELDRLQHEVRPAGPASRWSAALPPRLMTVLARSRPEGLILDEFDLAWQRSAIRGVAIDSERIDELAHAVSQELAGTGYLVVGASKKLSDDGRIYSFEIDIRPAELAATEEPDG